MGMALQISGTALQYSPAFLKRTTHSLGMTHHSFDYAAHVHAIARGDHHAFVALYHHEVPLLLALGKKLLGRRHDAEESVKDTFVLIWKHAESCDTSQPSVRAWIYSIFRHRVMMTLRQPGRIAPTGGAWVEHLPDAGEAGAHKPLYQALQAMDRAQRRPVLLAYFHGYNYRQIATLLEQTADQVRRQVRQTLRQLSRQLPQ